MNIFNSSSHSKQSTSRSLNKKRLSQDQVRLLEASFDSNKKLDPEQKLHLALQLGIPPRQIAIWYQNKRARWKNQSLELDYSALQLRLETTLVEKRQLEKEVEQLRVELNKAKEALIRVDQLPRGSPLSSGATAEDGGGGSSSSLHEDVSCPWQNGHREAMELEELYAYLMGPEASTRSSSMAQNGKFSFFKL